MLWARHSHAYVIQYPTWPVEWVQISVLLAYLDYWTTGSTDLTEAFMEEGNQEGNLRTVSLYNNTRLVDKDATGILNCSEPGVFHLGSGSILAEIYRCHACSCHAMEDGHARPGAQTPRGCQTRPGGGHHIIDWDPAPNSRMFHFSQHLHPNSAFCLRGLLGLAEIAGKLGKGTLAAQYAADAATLRQDMMAKMWNASARMFCDGICAEQPHTGVTTNSWALFNGVVPADGIAAAWQQAADFGLEGFGAASVAPCNPVVFD
eukprot:SAG25_NODE_1425_length_3058_cov_6.484623_3_plen_261_part_00